MIQTFAFIPRHDLPRWLALGWMAEDRLAGTHRAWSVLGIWPCNCEVKWPIR